MKFERLSTESMIERNARSRMVLAAATEIETKIGGEWKHDAKDSDKPIKVN